MDASSCKQSIWWQDDPTIYHHLLVNGGGAGIQEAGATDAADIASRMASMVGISSYLVDCNASDNAITVSLEAGVNGPVRVSTNSGSAPATLTRFVPGIYTAQVSSSAEIRAGDYVGVVIGTAHDEVVKVLSAGGGSFTAYLVHGIEIPDPRDLREAAQQLEGIRRRILAASLGQGPPLTSTSSTGP